MGNESTKTADDQVPDDTTEESTAADDKDGDVTNDNVVIDDENRRGPWFSATTNFETGVTTLLPNSDCDESPAYIFSRLYCDSRHTHAQPKVNTDLVINRFNALRKKNLQHLLANHVLIPNLRDFDANLGECQKLQRNIREQTLALRAAYKNPRINFLHRICRQIVALSKKNASSSNYATLDSMPIYGSVVLTVIPKLTDEFICGCMDTSGGYRIFRRSLSNEFDVVDAARTHECECYFYLWYR
jgi:hypothetical protein